MDQQLTLHLFLRKLITVPLLAAAIWCLLIGLLYALSFWTSLWAAVRPQLGTAIAWSFLPLLLLLIVLTHHSTTLARRVATTLAIRSRDTGDIARHRGLIASTAFGIWVYQVVFLAIVWLAGIIGVWAVWSDQPNDLRIRAYLEHGIELPPLATNIQCKGDTWWSPLDRGARTIFELPSDDLPLLIGQLSIDSRSPPRAAGAFKRASDPGNRWPYQYTDADVPWIDVYGEFERTWQGLELPIEIQDCASSTGDWLQVEIWQIDENRLVIKIYTNWN